MTSSSWSGGLTTFTFSGGSRDGLSPQATLVAKGEISVYPNPMTVGEQLEVDPTNLDQFDMQVINVSGQVIFKQHFSLLSGKFELNIKELNQPGIYFIRFISAEGVSTQKLMVK